MAEKFIFTIKVILITEALTHAVRSWGIFDGPRAWLKDHSLFAARLLNCFECSAVWVGAATIAYIYFIDFWPLTILIIISRAAVIINIIINYLDALRALTLNKV